VALVVERCDADVADILDEVLPDAVSQGLDTGVVPELLHHLSAIVDASIIIVFGVRDVFPVDSAF